MSIQRNEPLAEAAPALQTRLTKTSTFRHTPGPWVSNGSCRTIILDGRQTDAVTVWSDETGGDVALVPNPVGPRSDAEADAARIALAGTFCEGVSDENLSVLLERGGLLALLATPSVVGR